MSQPLTSTRLSFSSLGFFSELYRQYVDGFSPLSPYFHADYRSPEERRRVADLTARHERNRNLTADILLEQNRRWGEDSAAVENIEALRDSETVAVVTGQQVGLFTGPLYTIFKTITVLQMARQLAQETGRRVVPVFWLEGEDHDFAEISSVSILSANATERLAYPDSAERDRGGPVGRIRLGESIESTLDALDAALPPTDFKPALLAAARDAYRPGETLLDAFARLMRHIFRGTGLVFISSDDPSLKRVVAPLFEKEIRESHQVAERIDRVSEDLRREFHAQVSVRPTNLFHIDSTGRHAIDAADGSFSLRGTDRTFSADELLHIARSEPERLSANVVLRPMVQDTLLPTAVYVAGPSEIAYFAQLLPVYEWVGVPMPAIYPRASATLVERKVQKILDTYGLTIADLDENLESLFQRVVREQLDTAVDARFDAAGQQIHEALNGLRSTLEDVDRTLVKSAESTRATLLKEIDRLRHRVLKAEKRKHEQVRDKIARAQANLFPNGKPQERSISILYFLNKYGPTLIEQLQGTLDLDTASHQIVIL